MNLRFVLIVLIVISIIQISHSRGRSDRKKPINKANRRPMHSRSASRHPSRKGINSRGVIGDVGSAVGSAVGSVAGAAGRKAKQVVILIKCVVKCFIQNLLKLKICSQMFPCLYDCFIGQEYIPPDVQSEIDKNEHGAPIYPAAITLKGIYNELKCLFDCATERPIRNWETFVYVLYCFADTCVCYTMFGH